MSEEKATVTDGREKTDREINPPAVLAAWLAEHSAADLYLSLRRKVLGQDDELRQAAILVYGFLKNSLSGKVDRKYHFLIEGGSGCGKSTFAMALKEALPCPVIIADASNVTPAGFKGMEATDILADADLDDWWGCGVVVLDELDKLMEPSHGAQGENYHAQAISNFLKMLDGATVQTSMGKEVSTERILFIGMGAFSQLREQKREVRQIGFLPGEAAASPAAGEVSKSAMSGFCENEQFIGRFVTTLHFKPSTQVETVNQGEDAVVTFTNIETESSWLVSSGGRGTMITIVVGLLLGGATVGLILVGKKKSKGAADKRE